jgi:hypothetical protein
MNTTRLSAKTAACTARFQSKKEAQGAIRLMKAFATANGKKFAVKFVHTHSQYSALDWYYVVTFRFECSVMSDEEFEAYQTARALGRAVDARVWG